MLPFDARRGFVAALLLGIALGALSSFGDASSVVIVNALANAASPWLLAAFLAGAVQRSPGRAAIAGLLALGVALAAYYARLMLDDVAAPVALVGAWTVIVAVAGPLMAVVGWGWAHRVDRWRTSAVSLLAGAFLAEAAHRLIVLEAWDGLDLARTYAQLAVANGLGAIAVTLILLERRRWTTAFVAAPALAIGGLAVLLGVEAAFEAIVSGSRR